MAVTTRNGVNAVDSDGVPGMPTVNPPVFDENVGHGVPDCPRQFRTANNNRRGGTDRNGERLNTMFRLLDCCGKLSYGTNVPTVSRLGGAPGGHRSEEH